MDDRETICRTADVPLNGIRPIETAKGAKLCVANGGGRFYAFQAVCPHRGVPLCEAAFDGEVLTCLEHLWQWNLAAGGRPQGLAEVPLRMHALEIDGEAVRLSRVD